MADSTAADIDELERQLRQRERELAAVASITHALQAQLRLDDLMHRTVLAAMSTVDADAGSLLLHDAERGKLAFRHVEGPARERVSGLEIDDTQGIAGDVFHSGRARISQDVSLEGAHTLDIDRAAHYHTYNMISVPLRAGTGETIGVLQILNKQRGRFDEADLRVVEVLASQAASALINAQLHERARAAAIVDLLGQISHDIKNLLTPVTMAETTLRLMLTEFEEQMLELLASPPAGACELLPAIGARVREISRDVKEIFDIFEESTSIAELRTKELADTVKGLTTPPTYEPGSINDVAHGVCRVLGIVAEGGGVSLHEALGEVPETSFDAGRLYNALYNLVNNALDSTPAGGRVTVATSAVETGVFPEGGYVEIAVADTGCGMAPEVAGKLFSGHARSTKMGGTGLGTRVVKNVIEAHGGRLLVESAEGGGTTIYARLPIRPAE